jgi:hypothetical protein
VVNMGNLSRPREGTNYWSANVTPTRPNFHPLSNERTMTNASLGCASEIWSMRKPNGRVIEAQLLNQGEYGTEVQFFLDGNFYQSRRWRSGLRH